MFDTTLCIDFTFNEPLGLVSFLAAAGRKLTKHQYFQRIQFVAVEALFC